MATGRRIFQKTHRYNPACPDLRRHRVGLLRARVSVLRMRTISSARRRKSDRPAAGVYSADRDGVGWLGNGSVRSA